MNSWHDNSVILLLLVSVIASGCIDPNSYLPQPETLSEADKEAFSSVDAGILSKNIDAYTDRNILLRGKVAWISYEGGKTSLIINVQGTYRAEPVTVYYKGRLPESYMGTDVSVYGIFRGRDIIQNADTGEDIAVPKVYAVQIIPAGVAVTPVIYEYSLVSESKTLTMGETWDMGSGYALMVMALDGKATPKQVWFALSRNGIKLDDKVATEGEKYAYGSVFKTTVGSISDEGVVFRDTFIAS